MTLTTPAVLVQRTTASEQRRRVVVTKLTRDHLAMWGGAVVVENHVNVLRPRTPKTRPLLSESTLAAVLTTKTIDQLPAAYPAPSRSVPMSWSRYHSHTPTSWLPGRRSRVPGSSVPWPMPIAESPSDRPSLLPLDDCASRLEMIFPRAAFDTVLSNPLAASAVAAMVYVDAIVPDDGDLATGDVGAAVHVPLAL